MIARHRRGWTKTGDEVPSRSAGLEAIEGYRGGYILWTNGPPEIEFVAITSSTRRCCARFAGPDYTMPMIEQEAKPLFTWIENVANHYQVRWMPEPGTSVVSISAKGCYT